MWNELRIKRSNDYELPPDIGIVKDCSSWFIINALLDVVEDVAKNRGMCHTGALDVFSSSVNDPSAKNHV